MFIECLLTHWRFSSDGMYIYLNQNVLLKNHINDFDNPLFICELGYDTEA